MMMTQQVYAQVVSVALGLCKLYIILYRMVKAAQLSLGGFLSYRTKGAYRTESGAYRTKSVCKNPYNTSKYLVL